MDILDVSSFRKTGFFTHSNGRSYVSVTTVDVSSSSSVSTGKLAEGTRARCVFVDSSDSPRSNFSDTFAAYRPLIAPKVTPRRRCLRIRNVKIAAGRRKRIARAAMSFQSVVPEPIAWVMLGGVVSGSAPDRK